jgi:hypothetical protein
VPGADTEEEQHQESDAAEYCRGRASGASLRSKGGVRIPLRKAVRVCERSVLRNCELNRVAFVVSGMIALRRSFEARSGFG